MAYELHIDNRLVATFDTEQEALARAREAVQQRPDCEPEIRDSETKRAIEPGSTRNWRQELSNKVGY